MKETTYLNNYTLRLSSTLAGAKFCYYTHESSVGLKYQGTFVGILTKVWNNTNNFKTKDQKLDT